MKKVLVLVEGQTEEEFVRESLYEYMSPKGLHLVPIIAKTKRAIGGNPAFRGGIVAYGKIAFDLKRLVHDSSAICVTTMIDYYRLPSDFPGFDDEEAKSNVTIQCVEYLEKKFSESINHSKFLPYLSIHEFEALLFTDPYRIVQEVRGTDSKIQEILENIAGSYDSPEDINKDAPPSKRIIQYLKEYDKTVHAYLIAIEIGIEKMRQKCVHFDGWLKRLEALAVD